MALKVASIVLLMTAIYGAYGKHFRGGSMYWKPIENNQIQLTYSVGFKWNYTEVGFDSCTKEAQKDQRELRTSGKLKCDSCSADDAIKKLYWICDDYDVGTDSSVGHNTLIYGIPEGQQEFDISYEHCCWIDLESPIDRTGGAKGWKMMAHVNVQPRPDGTINSSPISAPIPVEKFHKGCEYRLRIAVSDPDNDAVRCRFAKKLKGECPADGNTKACGPDTDGLKINKKDCTLDFNTRDIAEGYHAVNVIIEDYLKPFKRKSQPLSKVSLLFLLHVEGESDSCLKPTIIDPPYCKTVTPGDHFEMDVVVEAGDPLKPVSRIKTQKPFGMTSSEMEDDLDFPNRKRVTLSWPTTANDIGEHSVCYSALDSDSYTSGISCTFIYIDDNPLQPEANTSYPADGGAVEAGDAWIVQFNKKIQRPKSSALITIVNPASGKIVFEIDAKNPNVTFGESSIEFVPSRDALFSEATTIDMIEVQYELQLEEGVAMPKSGGCGSGSAVWQIAIKRALHDSFNIKPGRRPPSDIGIGPRPFNMFKCTPSTLEIVVPNEAVTDGEQCFLHLMERSAVVSSGVISMPYNLCCPSSCGNNNDHSPADGQPAGPPGAR